MPGNILTAHFRTLFEDVLSPRQQDQAIDSLKDYIFDLQHGTSEECCDFDDISGQDLDEETVQRKISATLERCYWQLAMFLKSTRPCRIAEAEPYLRELLTLPTVLQDPTHYHEVHAGLCLAAALSSPSLKPTSAQDSEALLLFTRYFAIHDIILREDVPSLVIPLSRIPNALGLSLPTKTRVCHRTLPAKTELWSRACYARLLYKVGLDSEASRQTQLIRAYIRSHPYALPIEKYRSVISELALQFNLDLNVLPDDAAETHESDGGFPASPTFSMRSSALTASDSSLCASPVTPIMDISAAKGKELTDFGHHSHPPQIVLSEEP